MNTLLELEKIGFHFCPEDSQEDPAFPNHTDKDIWVNGFVKGVEVCCKAMIGEFSDGTKEWIVTRIKKHLNNNL